MSLNFNSISTEFNLTVESSSEIKARLFEGYRLDVRRPMPDRDEREVVLPPKAIETNNHKSTHLAAADSNPAPFTDRDESPTGSPGLDVM